MAGWKTYKIEDIVAEISAQAFALPVVQRRFVWEPEKITLLFDTVLKGDAFGGIMWLEEQADKVPLLPDALLWVAKRSHIREVAQATGTASQPAQTRIGRAKTAEPFLMNVRRTSIPSALTGNSPVWMPRNNSPSSGDDIL